MRVSVALNAYNRAEYVAETLESVLSQTRRPDDIVLMDDGSSDGTADVVRRFAPAVRYLRMENAGAGLSREAAVASATGDWVATCDSDDRWHPEHLENLIAAIEAHPCASFAFSNFTLFGDGASDYDHFACAPSQWWEDATGAADTGSSPLRVLRSPAYGPFLAFNPVFPTCLMASAEAYRAIGPAVDDFSRMNGEDADITRRLSLVGEGIADIRISVSIRKHVDNMSASLAKNLFGRYRILDRHVRELDLPPSLAQAAAAERDRSIASSFRHACWERRAELARDCRSRLPPGSLGAVDRLRYARVRLGGLAGALTRG